MKKESCDNVKYILEWSTVDGTVCYGYKSLKELYSVIETFKDKPYIRYSCYKVFLSQELLFAPYTNRRY